MARSKEGAGASLKDGQSFLEEHATSHHGKGRPSLGSMGHLCFSGSVRSTPLNSLSIRALPPQQSFRRRAGMSLAPRPGKGPLCMPRGGAGSHKASSMCLDVQALVPDTETQVGTETGAQESGEGQFHTAEGECFLPDHGPQHTQHNSSTHSAHPAQLQYTLSTPSTHPAHTQIPLSASVPERSTHLAKGKQTSRVGSMAFSRHGKCPFSTGSPAA